VTIKAIETRYAGCRFRSRLEARWAVFFDRMSIQWEYEPQGYVIEGAPKVIHQARGWHAEMTVPKPYLPDFWLPIEQLWVEVKGSEDELDHTLILNAVIPHGQGLPHVDRDKPSMIILGPVPRPGGRVGHSVLDFHKGDVWRSWAEFNLTGITIHEKTCYTSGDDDWLGNDCGEVHKPDPPLTSCAYLPGTPGEFVSAAYQAARSARFEHGETGR
jgi:hypothetical protein